MGAEGARRAGRSVRAQRAVAGRKKKDGGPGTVSKQHTAYAKRRSLVIPTSGKIDREKEKFEKPPCPVKNIRSQKKPRRSTFARRALSIRGTRPERKIMAIRVGGKV